MAEKIVRPILTYADECHHEASAGVQEVLMAVSYNGSVKAKIQNSLLL